MLPNMSRECPDVPRPNGIQIVNELFKLESYSFIIIGHIITIVNQTIANQMRFVNITAPSMRQTRVIP